MARWYVNPKRTKGGGSQRRPRVRVRGRTFVLGARSPFKGRVSRVNPIIRNMGSIIRNPIIRNPFIREVGMSNPRRRRNARRHYRRNPIIRNPNGGAPSLAGIMRDPLGIVMQGTVGMTSAYLTNTIPNMFNLFPGPDLVSKVLRTGVRVVVGSFVYGLIRSFSPRHANAAAVGAALGSVGAGVLDLFNTNLVLGYGDTTRTPMNLVGGMTTAFTGYGAYTRPMGAYTRPMGRLRGMSGVYGPGSMGMARTGSSIYGG